VKSPLPFFKAPVVAFEQYRLRNGLTVILHRDLAIPVAAVVVMYHVGSKNEKPGKTGFAHLFEHLMFKGSGHVADGDHFRLLQEIGATVNGSTTEDRTNYYEVVPSNHLELALYLESDRMGYLLPAVTQEKLDNQRDVVKNERRQNYDNQPYGTAHEKIARALYPADHPYSWPVIGSMEDLSAAALDDVRDFFRLFYAPNNACLVVAGSFDPPQVREWVEKYFGEMPAGPPVTRPTPAPASLAENKLLAMEDKVTLPRLFLTWHSFPVASRGDAVMDVLTSILSSGKSSRLYRNLVLERQIAQSVTAYQDGSEISGTTTIQVTAKPGFTLSEIAESVREVLKEFDAHGVSDTEIQSAVNGIEARLVARQASAYGKANGLATAFTLTGDTENYNKEFQRFLDITPDEVLEAGRRILRSGNVTMSVVPIGENRQAVDGSHILPPGGNP
jgi:zinc protease